MVPRDKFELEAVKKLHQMHPNEVIPLLPQFNEHIVEAAQKAL